MNPGYGGRVELPTSMKVLFRPCAMVVPDMDLIAEIMLMSEGTVPHERIVIDGDVDPEWIESMNTVMDDNKILTLASNERIPLTKPIRLVLEVENLREASPATVSRNGIIFVNDTDFGWRPFVASWIQNRDQHLFLIMNLNCDTDSLSLQTSMQSMVEKKTGKLFGPPGSKKLIYFIDDLNMPQVDKYGTQQPIALLRQHMDYGEWYERTKLTLKQIQGVQYISCLNPSAGSFVIDPRFSSIFGRESCDDLKFFFYKQRKDFQVKPAGRTMFEEHKLIFAIQLCMRILGQNGQLGSALFELSDPCKDRKWIMFDGPVADSWIESMNTLLDDNKKLYLIPLVGIEKNPGPPKDARAGHVISDRVPTMSMEDFKSLSAALLGAMRLLDVVSQDKTLAPFFDHNKYQEKNFQIETNEAAQKFVIDLNIDSVIDECCADGIDLHALLLDTGTNSKSITDLILEVRESCGKWETLYRYESKKHLASGMIDPVLFVNFLHDHPDVKIVLDAGMGAGVPLALAFAFFALFKATENDEEFILLGTDVNMFKLVKCHLLLAALKQVISCMKEHKMISTDASLPRVFLKLSGALLDKETGVFIFGNSLIPHVVLFNNQQIDDDVLHENIISLGATYVMSIRMHHFKFAENRFKYHLAEIHPQCANFNPATLLVLKQFDNIYFEDLFETGIDLIAECIKNSPHLQGSAVEIEIRSKYSKTKKTATTEKVLAAIICEQFKTICSKMTISQFNIYCPSVLMSTILYCLLKLLAKISLAESDENAIVFAKAQSQLRGWLNIQENAFKNIARVHSNIFDGTYTRGGTQQKDQSFWKQDEQWHADNDFASRVIGSQWIRRFKFKVTQEIGEENNEPSVEPGVNQQQQQQQEEVDIKKGSRSRSSSRSSSSSSSSSESSGYIPPSIAASEAKLHGATDYLVMFLQDEQWNVLTFLENEKYEDLSEQEKGCLKDVFAVIKEMAIDIFCETSSTILRSFGVEKQPQSNPTKAATNSAASQRIKAVSSLLLIQPPLESGNATKASKKPRKDLVDREPLKQSKNQYVFGNYVTKNSWNAEYLKSLKELYKPFKVQRKCLQRTKDEVILNTDFLRHVYQEVIFDHVIGVQWLAMFVNQPYSGHGHSLNSRNGTEYFQSWGVLDKYYGVQINEWKNPVANKGWSFMSVEFINCTFLMVNFHGKADKKGSSSPLENDEEAEKVSQSEDSTPLSPSPPSTSPRSDPTNSNDAGVPLTAPNFTISQGLLNLMADNERSWKLDRVEKLCVDADRSLIPTIYFVKTLKQTIVFHLSHDQGGTYDIDLTRGVAKKEDFVAALIFAGRINDGNTKYHQHLKLYQSSWPVPVADSSSDSDSDDDDSRHNSGNHYEGYDEQIEESAQSIYRSISSTNEDSTKQALDRAGDDTLSEIADLINANMSITEEASVRLKAINAAAALITCNTCLNEMNPDVSQFVLKKNSLILKLQEIAIEDDCATVQIAVYSALLSFVEKCNENEKASVAARIFFSSDLFNNILSGMFLVLKDLHSAKDSWEILSEDDESDAGPQYASYCACIKRLTNASKFSNAYSYLHKQSRDPNVAYRALYQMAIANGNDNELNEKNYLMTLEVLDNIRNVFCGDKLSEAKSNIRVCWAAVRALSGLLLKTPLHDDVYKEKIQPILNQLLELRSGRVCAQGAVLISATYHQYKQTMSSSNLLLQYRSCIGECCSSSPSGALKTWLQAISRIANLCGTNVNQFCMDYETVIQDCQRLSKYCTQTTIMEKFGAAAISLGTVAVDTIVTIARAVDKLDQGMECVQTIKRDSGVAYDSGKREYLQAQKERQFPEELTPNCFGLKNLGLTCWLNSFLQIMVHTTELSHFLLSHDGHDDKSPFFRLFKKFVHQMHLKSSKSEDIETILEKVLDEVGKLRIALISKNADGQKIQQDAHEGFLTVRNALAASLNRVREQQRHFEVRELANQGQIEQASKFWDFHMYTENSHIADIFCSQIRTVVTCGSCKMRSISFGINMDFQCALVPNNSGSLDEVFKSHFIQQEALEATHK